MLFCQLVLRFGAMAVTQDWDKGAVTTPESHKSSCCDPTGKSRGWTPFVFSWFSWIWNSVTVCESLPAILPLPWPLSYVSQNLQRPPRTTWGALDILSVRESPWSGCPGVKWLCMPLHSHKGTKYFMTCCLPHTASPLNVERINLGGQRKAGTETSMREAMI